MRQNNKLFGAVLLISGTAIGAGMLALPVTTGAMGFIPASVLFIACWLIMTLAAFLMLEVNLWLGPDANLITMADRTLGTGGKTLAWGAYLLLLYSLMAAYLSGMNAIITTAADHFFHVSVYAWSGSLVLILLFGVVIYAGAKPVDRINRLLMLGLSVSYIALVCLAGSHVSLHTLARTNLHGWWRTIPIIITAFGFHIIIPSMRNYLESDVKKLRRAILIGSCIPLIIYLVWNAIILGTIPLQGSQGLLAILASGQPAVGLTHALNHALGNHRIDLAARLFAAFAIATSFIGVSFSLFDFLSDGLHIKKTKLGRLAIAGITFIPPMFYALVYPRGFIVALGYAGIFVAILLILLPALMVWRGRKQFSATAVYRAASGHAVLTLLSLSAVAIIVLEIANHF